MGDAPFQLPVWLDLAAVTLFAVTGALAARRKRYDLVGVAVLALATGLGGAFLRDGLFLQAGPPAALRDGRYLAGVLAGAAAGVYFARHLQRFQFAITLADALGLGLYGVVGAQKALLAGLPPLSAVLVGTVNAVGGGVVRDVLAHDEVLIFRPGEFYALAAIAGCAAFVLLDVPAAVHTSVAAGVGVAIAFALRLASIRLAWRTGAVVGAAEIVDDGTP